MRLSPGNLLIVKLVSIFLYIGYNAIQKPDSNSVIPKDFVEINQTFPHVYLDLRYATANNFIGDTIDGYNSNKVFLTGMARDSLNKAIQQLSKLGYGIIIYDGYRPQKAVDMFVRWSRNLNDTVNKHIFYPHVDKSNLFKEGYIASKSGHSRGSTIDLGLVYLCSGEVADMGSVFDFFGPESAPGYKEISKEAIQRRRILRNAMLISGFKPLETEWWHFTLRQEPYPDSYFNFDIN